MSDWNDPDHWFSKGRHYPNGYYDERYLGVVISGREGDYGWGILKGSGKRFSTVQEARDDILASLGK